MLFPRQPTSPARPPARDGVSPSRVFLPKGQWRTCEDFLAERFPLVSRDVWQERMVAGEVMDAATNCIRPGQPYQHGTLLYYYRSLPSEPRIPFTETILYQDEWIVVADKPHFLPVTPAGRYLQETLLVRLKRRLGIEMLAPVHRIDRETAGLVVFACKPQTRAAYQSLFRDRRVEKTYEAIAPWRPEMPLPAIYRSRLVQSSASFMQMEEADGTPNAETAIRLIASRNDWAHYALNPLTGKKHQLRVHMAKLGIPIQNDRIYPHLLPEENDAATWAAAFANPLRLVARSLAFEDPFTRQKRYFESTQLLEL